LIEIVNTLETQIQHTLQVLQDKGTILYPTDTVWGLGCDATNEKVVNSIYKIKKRDESKSLVILVDSIKMLQRYIEDIPENVMQIIQEESRPTTIIYNNPIGLATNVVAQDNTVAVRIVQDEFCQQLIHTFGKPIVSTSANISGSRTPTSFKEIEESILNAVDYIVNLHHDKVMSIPSKIIRVLKGGDLEVIRE